MILCLSHSRIYSYLTAAPSIVDSAVLIAVVELMRPVYVGLLTRLPFPLLTTNVQYQRPE